MTTAQYISRLNTLYHTGTATENSYRGDLQTLIMDLLPDILVTNEPTRVNCGAPDYVLTRKEVPAGYIGVKEVRVDLNSKSLNEQFDRYKAGLSNIIITDFLHFQVNKTCIETVYDDNAHIFPYSVATPDCPADYKKDDIYIRIMTKLTTVIVVFCSLFALKAQNSANNFQLGIITSIDKNLSSETMAFDQHTGYSADYDKINYRLGLNLKYQLKQDFSINTAIQYSSKDFTGTYSCAVCDFSVPPSPENIDFRLIEVPLSLRYYFLPDRFGVFGEVGINNQFLLNGGLTDKSYAFGIKLGAGLEYDFTQRLAFQIFIDYNRGITNLYNESDFKIDFSGFGVGLMKRI